MAGWGDAGSPALPVALVHMKRRRNCSVPALIIGCGFSPLLHLRATGQKLDEVAPGEHTPRTGSACWVDRVTTRTVYVELLSEGVDVWTQATQSRQIQGLGQGLLVLRRET